MIENINSNENETMQKLKTITRLPKNIRQIGDPDSDKKIYIEDYVYSFLYRFAGKHKDKSIISVLVGRYERFEDSKIIVITGAVRGNYDYDDNEDPILTKEGWNIIYEDTHKYFPNQEIIGWAISREGFGIEISSQIEKIHIDNFAGVDKLLFMMDLSEREDAFYIYQNNTMVKQRGYYVFFDRNEEMQAYIVSDKNEGEPEAQPDEFITNIRSAINERKQNIIEQKKVTAMVYVTSISLILTVLVTGVVLINNYDKMKNMQQTLKIISKENNSTDVVSTNTGMNIDKNNSEEKSTDNAETDNVINEENVTPKETKNPSEQSKSNTDNNDKKTSNKTYIIKRGDTLIAISKKIYNSSNMVEQIKSLNNIEDIHKIYEGQEIILP